VSAGRGARGAAGGERGERQGGGWRARAAGIGGKGEQDKKVSGG
jgi:hypothetical protein